MRHYDPTIAADTPAGLVLERVSPEMALLLACARAAALRRPVENLDVLLAAPLDWNLATNLALEHSLMPALYRGLSSAAPGVPAAAMRDLRVRYEVNDLHVNSMTRDLLGTLARFQTEGIAAIAFKGPVLSRLAYGEIAMRQFVDCDVLVRREDVPHAAEVLAEAGYVPRTFDARRFTTGFFHETADEFAQPDRLGVIDLHWKVMAWYFAFAPHERDLFARARPVDLLGQSVISLAPEDLMLVLATHAAKHGWASIGQVAEIAGLMNAERELGWEAILQTAARLSSRFMLLLAVWLARAMFDAPCPDHVSAAAAADPGVASLGTQIVWRMTSRSCSAPGVFHRWIVPLRSIERARDRLRFVRDLALSPTGLDGAMVRLPRILYPLYYPLRPARLAMRKLGETARGARAHAARMRMAGR